MYWNHKQGNDMYQSSNKQLLSIIYFVLSSRNFGIVLNLNNKCYFCMLLQGRRKLFYGRWEG